jgi:hypothetical protein
MHKPFYKSNILIKKKLAAIYLYQSLHLSEVSAQESVNKSFVRVRYYTKRSNKKNVSKFSRNMFTEIMCEICINHFVEIIFTLSCAVVDINLLQIKIIIQTIKQRKLKMTARQD